MANRESFVKIYISQDLHEEKTRVGVYTYGIVREKRTEFNGNYQNVPKNLYVIEPIDYIPEKIHKYLEWKNIINKKSKFTIHNRKMLR